MEPVQEHGEELRQTGLLDNVPEWGVRGSGTEAWVHIAEQPPGIEDHALLYWVRWSIYALELKCAALKMKKR